MAKQPSDSSSGTVRHAGPPLIVPGAAFAGLFAASLAAGTILSGGGVYPMPFGSADASRYFVEHAAAVRVVAFLQFGAAIPLGLFTATVVSRLRFLGIEAAGVTIALFGGMAASFFLAVSALVQWVLASPGVAEVAADARVLQLLAFATGGPGHVVPLGLLVAGVSLTGGLTRLLPRWLMWFGLVLAAFAELSTLTLILDQAVFFLPLARFPAFIWIIGVALTLPASRTATIGAASRGPE